MHNCLAQEKISDKIFLQIFLGGCWKLGLKFRISVNIWTLEPPKHRLSMNLISGKSTLSKKVAKDRSLENTEESRQDTKNNQRKKKRTKLATESKFRA